MGLPTLTFRIALTTAPLATPTWATQGASKLLGFVTERGRPSELDDFQAGTATYTLDNRDRGYDPANTSGANYGNLKPRKRVSLQATWSSITYDLSDGFTNSWPQKREKLLGTVELPVTDAFSIFQGETFASDQVPAPIADDAEGGETPLDPTFIWEARAVERSDQRLGWILDEAGWPAGRRTFSTGVVEMMPYGYAPKNVLNHMKEIEDTEGGFLFMDAAGNVVFQSKYFRLNNYGTSQGTFSDSPTGAELPFVDFEPEQDVAHIINHSTGRRANDADTRVYEFSDATSRTDYGPAASTLELWANDQPEIEARTQYLVDRYKQPIDRIKSITLNPQMDDNLWPHCLGRVIGERITVKSRYFGKGSVQTQESRIEGIRHEYASRSSKWTTTFRLSPLAAQEIAGYWLLGTSVLGSTTTPAW